MGPASQERKILILKNMNNCRGFKAFCTCSFVTIRPLNIKGMTIQANFLFAIFGFSNFFLCSSAQFNNDLWLLSSYN